MIKSWADKEARKLFNREPSLRIPENNHKAAFRKLRMLNRSMTLDDLRVPPGNRLESLADDRKGTYGIRINDQWRICFVWQEGNAYEEEIVHYRK
jgi:toxin HigB-1